MNVLYIVIGFLIVLIVILIYFLVRKTKRASVENTSVSTTDPKSVGEFYNQQSESFLKVYGKIIQAFRTKDVAVLLDYQIKAIGLKPGMVALDAGCGVCGPAIYFAKNAGVSIEAITISAVQKQKSEVDIANENLTNQIKVIEGDYHLLEKYYPADHFDAIYFLESFGHAANHCQVLDSAWKVLKPGGVIYIKDLFRKKVLYNAMEKEIEKEINNINKAYHYNVADLNDILDHARKKGYILSSLKTIDIPLGDFENLTISNDFQKLTGINKIENLREYVFPVDFFELKLMRPTTDVLSGNSRYFLQNLYFVQMENWKESDL